MKKLLAVLLALTLACSFAACGDADKDKKDAGKDEEQTEAVKTIDEYITEEYEGYELAAADIATFWRVGDELVSYSQSDSGSTGLHFGASTPSKDDFVSIDVNIYVEPDMKAWVEKYNVNWPDEQFEEAEFIGMKAYKRPSSLTNGAVYVLEYEGVSGAFLEFKTSYGDEADASTLEAFAQAIWENMIFRVKE